MARPHAVSTGEICSECGLDWQRHGENPTKDDCIRLLKADLVSAEARIPKPWPWPYGYWQAGIHGEAKLIEWPREGSVWEGPTIKTTLRLSGKEITEGSC